MQLTHRPFILIVLDGFGYSERSEYNAIQAARKPTWDRLWREYPHALINASGTHVGLPGEQMGNSEVGHMNIGSGRIVRQEFSRISAAIEDGSFFHNEVLVSTCAAVARTGKAIHILGLLSDGGVHSHQDHINALIQMAHSTGVKNIYLHAFLDGRDTPPQSAGQYIDRVERQFSVLGHGRIASITGRYYAMDRNNNWDRVATAYQLLSQGIGQYRSPSAREALAAAYARKETDEFVKPTAIVPPGAEALQVADGDAIIFANFRADRARQLSMAFTERNFDRFPRGRVPMLQNFISLTEYKAEFTFPAAYPPEKFRNVLGAYLAKHGLRQLRIAETEKYAHVTFFFNGGEETVFEGEDRILVPSPAVPTYDLKPEMSAFEVTDKLTEAIESGKYDVIISNFANADMVGHTGDFDAAVKAIEALDQCLDRITTCCLAAGGELLITSDHGNAEKMREFIGTAKEERHTAHTSNLVPFLYIGRPAVAAVEPGALCDIAPTLLYLMGLELPREMTGKSLVTLTAHVKQARGVRS
ncbi:MAG: phosphoglyceromutase [Gammaproteobacteria bacterium]|nr:phosphoglyceromutase [Gammaproteobacteria bacterium]